MAGADGKGVAVEVELGDARGLQPAVAIDEVHDGVGVGFGVKPRLEGWQIGGGGGGRAVLGEILWKLPAGASVSRSKTWNQVSGACWSTASQ